MSDRPQGLAFVPPELDAPPSAFYSPAEMGEGGAPARGKTRSPRQKGLHALLKAGPIVASLADGAATANLLKKGGREVNPALEPFAENTPLMMGTMAAKGALMSVAADQLAKHGHRDLAKVLSAINIALPLGAAAHNLLEARKMDRARTAP